MDNQIVNKCSKCGNSYTLEQWNNLRLIGYQSLTADDLPAANELRECHCGSTRMIGLDPDGNYYEESEEDILAEIKRSVQESQRPSPLLSLSNTFIAIALSKAYRAAQDR